MQYFILLAFIIVTSACGGDDDNNNTMTIDTGNNGSDMGNVSDEGVEDMAVVYTSLDERPCPDDSTLTYENFGASFALDWCTSCHHSELPEGMRQMATVGIDFDDVEGIRDQAARIWLRSADQNNTMPPVGGPSQKERDDLGEWLACGAP